MSTPISVEVNTILDGFPLYEFDTTLYFIFPVANHFEAYKSIYTKCQYGDPFE